MSEPSPNGNGAENGSTPPARLPGESGTAYSNRLREAKAQQEREERQAQEQQDRERLDALTSRAAQLVQALERLAGAIPPDLAQQLAAVRSETQEARTAAGQVHGALAQGSEAVRGLSGTTAEAREWHTALTAAKGQIVQTFELAERSARASHERAASTASGLTWRVWATAGAAPLALVLLLTLVLWAADPLRAAAAGWLMTAAQQTHQRNGLAIEDSYLSPQATAVDRCLMESYARWPRRQGCPPPPPGSGLRDVNASTRLTPKRDR